MLESNSFPQSFDVKFYVPHSFNALVQKGVEELQCLVLPEDTTETVVRNHSDSVNLEVNNTRSTVKGVIWIAISVAMALAIGQLQ